MTELRFVEEKYKFTHYNNNSSLKIYTISAKLLHEF